MTKATNYLATVTDVNSEFPAKGAAVPNSNRCVIKDQTGQTVGSLGATNNWYVDESASPFVTYTNARLPRWQDLVPLTTTTTTTIPGPTTTTTTTIPGPTTTTTTTILNCNFTFSTVQVPSSPVLDSTTAITIFFDNSGSMAQVLPALEDMKNNVLKPCLLPYYNNDSDLYDQRVTITSLEDERVIQWLGALPPGGATKVVNLTFSNESDGWYTTTSNTNTTVNPWVFLPNAAVTTYYTQDINLANSRLSTDIRGIAYRIVYYFASYAPEYNIGLNNITKGFYNAVFTGQGNYAGANGLSTNGYANLIDDVSYSGNGQYYANKVIEGMNLLGYNLSPC